MTPRDLVLIIFVVAPLIVLSIGLRIWQWKNRADLLKAVYSDKRFDEITAGKKEWDLPTFRAFVMKYMIVAWIIGLILLFLHSRFGQIGLLLWGITALLAGLYACVSYFTTEAEDLKWNDRAQTGVTVAKYCIRVIPLLAVAGALLLPESSRLIDNYAIFNVGGVLCLTLIIAAFPILIVKVEKKIFKKK